LLLTVTVIESASATEALIASASHCGANLCMYHAVTSQTRAHAARRGQAGATLLDAAASRAGGHRVTERARGNRPSASRSSR
jgi:hypothetical protein